MNDGAHASDSLPIAALIGFPFLALPWLMTLGGLEFPFSILIAIACLVSLLAAAGIAFALFRRRTRSPLHRLALIVCLVYFGAVLFFLFSDLWNKPDIEIEWESDKPTLRSPTGSTL